MYHYASYAPAYACIRGFVAAYVWMTGWGNTLYFKRTGDYSARRVFEMLWRINFLVALLSLASGTPWIAYYVVAPSAPLSQNLFLFSFLLDTRRVLCCKTL